MVNHLLQNSKTAKDEAMSVGAFSFKFFAIVGLLAEAAEQDCLSMSLVIGASHSKIYPSQDAIKEEAAGHAAMQSFLKSSPCRRSATSSIQVSRLDKVNLTSAVV